jgi:hypothetical protein
LVHQFKWIAVLAVFGVVLGAWYMLWLVERVFFGPLREPAEHGHGGHAMHGHSHGSFGHSGHEQGSHASHSHDATGHGGHDAHGHDSHGHDSHGHSHAEAPLPGPHIPDLKLREFLALAPLCIFIVWIGVQPSFFLKRLTPEITDLTVAAETAFDKQSTAAKPAVASTQPTTGRVAASNASERGELTP